MPEKPKVLVTGANGLLGSNIADLLGKDNRYRVRAMVRRNADLSSLEGTSHELFVGNITSREDIDRALEDCSYVIHCAARTAQNPSALKYYREANIDATELLVEICHERNIKRFVFVSTTNCFTNGSIQHPGDEEGGFMPWLEKSGYAYSKYIAQQAVLKQVGESGFPAVVVAPGFLIGPRDAKPSSGQLLLYVLRNKILFCPPGGKSFVDVRIAAKATIEALTSVESGQKWLLTGRNMTYRDFFRAVAKLQGSKKIIIPIPLWLMKVAGFLFDLAEKVLRRSLLFNSTQQRLLCLDNYFSNRKAKDELAMPETDVEEALESALWWFQQNGHKLR